MLRPLLALSFMISAAVPAIAQEKPPTPEEAFRRAVEFTEANDYESAIPLFEYSLSEKPEFASAAWNLGTAAIIAERYEKAVRAWEHYQRLEPDDWQVLPKLIQSHHGAGNLEARDDVRRQLFALHESGDNDSLSERRSYCREQFPLDGNRVFAYEYFEPLSVERAKFYEFYATDESNNMVYSISMGSYKTTNAISLTGGNHKPHERLYHFDGYLLNGAHWTIGFYVRENPMPYDEAREILLRSALKGPRGGKSMTVPDA